MKFPRYGFKPVLLCLTAAVVLLSACSPASIPVTGTSVTYTTTEFAFDGPDQIEAGLVRIRMENAGEFRHHTQVFRLNDDATLEQFNQALQQGEGSLFTLVTAEGGPGVVAGGGSQEVSLNLDEGQYVLVCFVTGGDGIPHLAKGMVKPVQVTAGPDTGDTPVEPESDLTVTMKDFTFDVPAEVAAGEQTWEIVNAGPQVHELEIVKLNEGATMQDFMSSMASGEGQPPGVAMGGMQGLSANLSGWLHLNLEPGNYVAICQIPDAASGKSHAELGMVMAFTVR